MEKESGFFYVNHQDYPIKLYYKIYKQEDCAMITIYAKYWIINRTNKPLQY